MRLLLVVPLVALSLAGAEAASAQREFIEEIEPETKKGSLDGVDLDAPDPGKKPRDPTKPKDPAQNPANPAKPDPAKPAKPDPANPAKPDPAKPQDPATQPEDTGAQFTILLTGRDAFLEKWDLRAQAVKKGETARAKKLLADIDDALLEYGVQGVAGGTQAPAAATALLLESKRALDEGNFETAHALTDAAQRAAPDLVAVHTHHALVAWRAGDIGKTVQALLDAGRAVAADPLLSSALLARAVAVLAGALVVVLLLLAFLSGLPALRYLAFDLSLFLPKGAHPGQVLALVVLVGVAPLFLGAGPMFSALWVLTLAWMYLRKTGRVVVLVLAVACVSVPFLVDAGARLVAYPGSRADRAQRALVSVDAVRERAELAALPADQLDFVEQGALGMQAKREGRLEDALTLLSAAAEKAGDDPLAPFVHGELGVVYALKNNEDKALSALGKASALDARLIPAQFDASLLHYRGGRTDKAEAAIQPLARSNADALASFRRTTYREADQIVTHNRAFVDVLPPASAFLARGLAPSADAQAIEGNVALLLLHGQTGQRAAGILGLFALVCMLAAAARKRLRPACACVRCGDPASPRVNGIASARATPPATAGSSPPQSAPEDTCAQCFHAFVSTRSRIDAGVKLRKERAIARRGARVSRVTLALSVVFPGAGHLYAGALARGVPLAFSWAVLLGAGACVLGLWPLPRLSGAWSDLPAYVALGIGAIVIWGVSLKSQFTVADDVRRGK